MRKPVLLLQKALKDSCVGTEPISDERHIHRESQLISVFVNHCVC